MVIFNYFMEIWLIGAYHIVSTLFAQTTTRISIQEFTNVLLVEQDAQVVQNSIMQNFTEAGHGKGEHDGVGTCIKRALAHEELKYKDGAILMDAKSIVQWCNATMGLGKEGESMVHRFFWLIDNTNIA